VQRVRGGDDEAARVGVVESELDQPLGAPVAVVHSDGFNPSVFKLINPLLNHHAAARRYYNEGLRVRQLAKRYGRDVRLSSANTAKQDKAFDRRKMHDFAGYVVCGWRPRATRIVNHAFDRGKLVWLGRFRHARRPAFWVSAGPKRQLRSVFTNVY